MTNQSQSPQHNDGDGIPIIDFSPWSLDSSSSDGSTDHEEAKNRVARDIFEAFSKIGFIIVVNHGIRGDDNNNNNNNSNIEGNKGGVTAKAFEAAKDFFALPVATKQSCAYLSNEANRGYIAMGQEKLDSQLPDIKETFDIGFEGETAYQNRWPHNTDICKAFRQATLEYFEEYDKLHLQLLRALARGMGFDNDDYFTPLCNGNHQNLRLLHYPECDRHQIHKSGQKRGGIHTDYGTLTLLSQQDVSGLVAQRLDGTWVPVPPLKGGIVVNVGEMLQRWSNDTLRATPHQVLDDDPLLDDSQEKSERVPERYSIAFFCNANKDTSLECLPVCATKDNPPKYEPMNAFDYITMRLNSTIPVMPQQQS